MSFKIEIETGNSAFESDKKAEVARILQTAIDKLNNGQDSFPLYDLNGNKVGSAEFEN